MPSTQHPWPNRLVVTGNGAGDQLALGLQTGVPTTVELDVGNDGSANFSFDRALFERVAVNAPRATTPDHALGGTDTITVKPGAHGRTV